MLPSRRAALLWSGGKDSVLALHHVRRRADMQVVRLVTCLSQAYDRVSMHGVRRALVQDQADALGLPIEFILIPSHEAQPCPRTPGTDFPPNDVYSRTMLAAFAGLKEAGIEVVIFGDIFLEDLRAYREGLLLHAGLEGHFPLWGRDTTGLYDEFLTLGFQAITVCIDTERLTEGHCGRLLTRDFLDSLPAEIDPCGERGEYHTFVFDGPPFPRPVAYTAGEIHCRTPFAFQELFPASVSR